MTAAIPIPIWIHFRISWISPPVLGIPGFGWKSLGMLKAPYVMPSPRRIGFFFLDFVTDQTENVYPMISAGAGHNEMVLKPLPDGSAPMERELA